MGVLMGILIGTIRPPALAGREGGGWEQVAGQRGAPEGGIAGVIKLWCHILVSFKHYYTYEWYSHGGPVRL